jgi:signal transduction histidine kinase
MSTNWRHPGAARADEPSSRGAAWVWASMVLAVCAVAAIAYWDAQREASSALEDFAAAQVALANGLADPVAARLARAGGDAANAPFGLHRVEKPGHVELLFARSDRPGLLRTDGVTVRHPAIEEAIAKGASWVRLTHEEAAALGLPARTAIAGLAPVASVSPSAAAWTIAVVATAQEERDRELRAQRRLVLAIAVGAGLVLAFGGLALRKQRKELELARELAVASVERKRDELLVRADKLATMAALAGGIAHEVSTPLGVIVGRAEQIRPKLEHDERGLRAVDAILEQGERIGRVIRGFLSLARGESPSFERAPPEAIARASVDLVEHRFSKAGVALESRVEGALPPIACEPRLLEQALVNLLLNACDACPPGGHVALDVHRASGKIAFVVTDDGAGIAPELVARAAEPFFTTKPAGKGTGLGLAIATEIVKHHRGALALEPRAPAKGTRASIEVPAAEGDHERAPAIS